MKMKRKILSLILVVVFLVVNLAAVSIFSTIANTTPDSAQQIRYTGGWNPSGYETAGELYKDRIAVSKTVVPTEHENYFDVTLKVVAKKMVIDQSVDVVVVMDNSSSMNATHQNIYPGSSGYDENEARLTHAKNAVNLFIDKYAEDKNISQNRGFGLVTFNSYANTVVPLSQLNTVEKATEIKNAVNAVTAPADNRLRCTNAEGGLQLAKNILDKSDAVYKYIIFMTDGFPTTYIESGKDSLEQITGYDTYMTGAYDAGRIDEDGYFADSVTGKITAYGASYSDKAADKADDVAEKIKKSGVNLFSIGIDVDIQSVPEYVSLTSGADFTVVDRRSEDYVVGSTRESYKNWLSGSIAGGTLIDTAEATKTISRYSDGNSLEQMETAFANILKDIEIIPSETMQEAYTIDPMSDYVEFRNFYDKDGNIADSIVNTNNGTDVATFDADKKQIRWNLTNTQSYYLDENTGNYVLYITYKVRLKNEQQGFVPSEAFDTNKTATLYFKTVDLESGEPLYGENSIDYPVPQVEGYYGTLEFTKQDSVTEEPLSGAEFVMQHYGNSCHICSGDAYIEDVNGSSDENGKVVFENIPSGHEYFVIETKAPEGYQPGSHHSVEIAYGKTYFDRTEVTPSTPAVIKNQTIKPVEVVLSAKKNISGGEIEAGKYTFVLKGVGQDNIIYHDKETNDEKGNVVFKGILFDEVGTYNFTVQEEKGNDPAVVYDSTVYDVELNIFLNEDSTEYIVETKINGKDVENDSAPEALEFTNIMRKSVKVTLQAKKYLDDKTPQGTFTFELYDDKGNLIQSKHNNGTDVIFDPITYTETGVYNYQIIEGHECAGHDEQTDDHHIFFDHTVYNAEVTVIASEDSEKYEAEVVYYLSGKRNMVEEVVFNNHERKDASLKLRGLKTVNGKNPQSGKYSFELRDEKGEVVQTVTNNGSGVIEFDELVFNKVGYSKFTVNEVKGDNDKIVYDDLVYTINVVTEALHINPDYYLEVIVVKSDESDEAFCLCGTDLELNEKDFIKFANINNEVVTENTDVTTEPPTENTVPSTDNSQEVTEDTEPTTESEEPETEETDEPEETETEDRTDVTDSSVKNTTQPVSSPQTGDSTNIALWLSLLLISSGVIVGAVYRNKKGNN